MFSNILRHLLKKFYAQFCYGLVSSRVFLELTLLLSEYFTSWEIQKGSKIQWIIQCNWENLQYIVVSFRNIENQGQGGILFHDLYWKCSFFSAKLICFFFIYLMHTYFLILFSFFFITFSTNFRNCIQSIAYFHCMWSLIFDKKSKDVWCSSCLNMIKTTYGI